MAVFACPDQAQVAEFSDLGIKACFSSLELDRIVRLYCLR